MKGVAMKMWLAMAMVTAALVARVCGQDVEVVTRTNAVTLACDAQPFPDLQYEWQWRLPGREWQPLATTAEPRCAQQQPIFAGPMEMRVRILYPVVGVDGAVTVQATAWSASTDPQQAQRSDGQPGAWIIAWAPQGGVLWIRVVSGT